MPIPAICSDMRLFGGSAGLPLFVDDCYSRLVIRRLTSPQQPGQIDRETAMSLDLPDGVDGEEVYIGGLAVSRSSSDARCLPLGISAIVVATRSYIFGTRTAGYRQMWSVLPVKEPAEGRSFERQGLRTFVSMLFDGEESAYLLDASRRLCFTNWDADGRLQMHELPIQGGKNALLDDGVEELKMVWLLQLPLGDHRGTNLVCLAYRWFHGFHFGRFVAFDLTEGEATRLWVFRPNILGELCVLVGWGPGAVAVVYNRPGVVGLKKGRIYSSLDGLRSYVLGWNYSDMRTVPSYWPVSLWINPEFPNPLSLEDTFVKVIMEDFADADAENKAPDDADAIDQVEELSASAPMLAGVGSQNDAATTGPERVTMVPTAAPAPLLDRLLRRTLLQLNSGFD
ncbi:hypothetical protein PAHAL_6G189300 [Panicum hallii]|uniref:Uncharacterized protein n=1 Tax=Panicum hallii TaxID=206008 RepID=A0A2S3I2A5_9POAL|nr:uncharacterized protein LOC112897545 [Panicum hallii]XP_025821643.1 uncharacterized protein LOC112897545 [Panicum hallii]XP_025821644.1 uncharacterized protein LOC112897545 [Panicum hallii]XP_025821645.1 uncharacterized protein LOC112897545 [Panicum hallii]XP_025821646.1 uncharacterized protein LOC112897545 [Panicum hallii]XP_025821647.1 uncharacterized protein LOC112897545 [Panicum hallii]XP_025821648.1 uncharacterized protein LOC112897545 [Panicum hallii]XP_025821649.1 uncharacterized p